MYFGCLTLKADFVKFCASLPSGRKPSSEGKGEREIKQLFHPERRYPSNNIFIPCPHNSKAVVSDFIFQVSVLPNQSG